MSQTFTNSDIDDWLWDDILPPGTDIVRRKMKVQDLVARFTLR